MAVIVGIHGIAQQYRGGYQLGTIWYNGIRDGLVRAGHESIAETLRPADVRVAFFGDLFRPPGAMAAAGPPYSAENVRPGPERDLLGTWFEGTITQDSAPTVPEGAMGVGQATVHVMLERLARSPSFARVAQRAFIGNLKQVTSFLADHRIKQAVLARVHALVGDNTRIVIGHSLGSVVAYEYLCRERPGQVELLVTLGSPLGIPNLVFEKLTPAPVRGAGSWAGSVAAWANIADPHDVVALRKDLAPLFTGERLGQAVADRLVDNGNEPHAVDRYLNTRESGSSLGPVLGDQSGPATVEVHGVELG